MPLTASLARDLHAAILGAFSEDELRMALLHHLNFNYDHDKSGTSYKAHVFDLIGQFDREGRIGELLDGLRAERPRNDLLRQVSLEWCADRAVAAPAGLPARNSQFIGRADGLRRLHERLKPGTVLWLTGMPGVGKSDLALEYVYLHAEDWRFIAWCNAATLEDLLGSYAQHLDAGQLGVPSAEITARAAAFRRRLLAERHWLLVLDNVNDFDVLAEWVPVGLGGCVLVTARQNPNPRFAELVVDLLPPDDALELLIKDVPLDDAAAQQDARDLVELLGRLPLALNYSRGLIAAGHYSVDELLDISRRGGFLDVVDPDVSLRRAIRTCVDRARKREPLAAEALLVSAFLCPDGVPEEVLQEACAAGSAVDMRRVVKQVGEALLRRDAVTKQVRVHRVIQEVLRSIQPAEELRGRAARVVDAVARLFPTAEPIEHWKQCERLRASATACAGWIEQFGLRSDDVVRLLHRLAYYLDGQGLHFAVEPLYLRALAISEALHHDDDPGLARLRNHVGWMYRSQGRFDEAEHYYGRALAALERCTDREGRHHLASALHNLATLIHDRGRFADALAIHQRALAIQRELGEELKVALSLNNLGWLLAEMDRLDEADELLVEALRIRRARLSGGDHPDIATTLGLQAYVLRRRGQRDAARVRYREALAMRERHLGSSHPRLTSILNELGEIELERGDPAAAAQLFGRAEALLTAAGLDRVPDAAWWRRGRARLAARAGDYEEALRWYEQALERAREAMSDAHPDLRDLAAELAALKIRLDSVAVSPMPGPSSSGAGA